MPVARAMSVPRNSHLRGESISPTKIVLTVLAAWVASLAIAASAQTTDPRQERKRVHRADKPLDRNACGAGSDRSKQCDSSSRAANVLEDAPRDHAGGPG